MTNQQIELPPVDNLYLPFWRDATKARCIKDNPPMYGFGRQIKKGDVVETNGVTWRGHYELSVPAECAFYVMEGYFIPEMEADMIDMVEIRNAEGEKINVRLEMNKTPSEDLGEWYAQVRIAHEPYMLVAEQNNEPRKGDMEGRTWKLVHPKEMRFPDEFFEKENIGMLVQIISPYIGEEKLAKVIEVLES